MTFTNGRSTERPDRDAGQGATSRISPWMVEQTQLGFVREWDLFCGEAHHNLRTALGACRHLDAAPMSLDDALAEVEAKPIAGAVTTGGIEFDEGLEQTFGLGLGNPTAVVADDKFDQIA